MRQLLLWTTSLLTLAGAAAAQTTDGAPGTPPARHAAPHTRHHRRTPSSRQVSRPPAQAALATPPAAGPAPVPNEAVAAPVEDPNPTASVAPSVFQLHYPPQGDGYVTGSSTQGMDDRNAAKATGVEVKVPLPQ